MRFAALILSLPLTAAIHHVDCGRTLAEANSIELHPGDQLLLKSGCRWTGTLHPRGSGAEGRPIRIGRYGDGPLPAIDGAGAEAAVLLHNQEFVEISDLELTNRAAEPGLRRGLLVRGDNSGRPLRHIHVRGLRVHDVKGRLGADMESKLTGGIGFEILARQRATRYDGVVIEGNEVRATDNTGIYLYSDVSPHPRDPNWESLRNTGIVVRGNTLEDIGKNAIAVRAALNPLIERNTVRKAAARYHGNAIYVFGCKNALIQWNEVSGTRYHKLEGAAFDSDYNSEGTVIRYNYSHENGGGLVNLCNNPASKAPRGYNDGTIVRFNLSRNETDRVIGYDGPVTNSLVDDNTIYIGRDNKPEVIVFDTFGKTPGFADRAVFRNNTIVNEGGGIYNWGQATNISLEGNCFQGRKPDNLPAGAQSSCASVTPMPHSPVFLFQEGVVWSKPQGIELKADLYLPNGPGPFPVILYLHGGGWSSGTRTQLRRQAAHMAALGVAGVAIQYRLSGQAPYPAAFEDAKAALEWIHANAARYHLNPRRIAVAGSSAGGHLASLLGVNPGRRKVVAAAAFNPVLDLPTMPRRGSSIPKFLGAECEQRIDLCREASPFTHAGARSAPFLILHGTADQSVPYQQATSMVAKLKAAGVRAELFTAEGGPHTFWANAKWFDTSLKAMQQFLLPYLR